MDDLKIDVLITASQKAWMSSPGISMIAVSEKAKERQKIQKYPGIILTLLYMKNLIKNQTPATPAVSVLFSLKTALEIMRQQGREKYLKTS